MINVTSFFLLLLNEKLKTQNVLSDNSTGCRYVCVLLSGFFFFYVLVFNLENTKQTTIPAMIVAHFISHCADLPEHSSQSRLVL